MQLCQLTKGVGIATCNFAEYRALILGLQAAVDQGIHHIKAQGDSKLVCNQVNIVQSAIAEVWSLYSHCVLLPFYLYFYGHCVQLSLLM